MEDQSHRGRTYGDGSKAVFAAMSDQVSDKRRYPADKRAYFSSPRRPRFGKRRHSSD